MKNGFSIVRISSQYDGSNTVVQIIFTDTAASRRHTGGDPFNSRIGRKFQSNDIPSHLSASLALLIEKTLIPFDPPGLKFLNHHLLYLRHVLM